MYRSLVVIPTYNECENIELLLKAIFSLKIELDVLVVDDNSPDGTAGVVIKMQQYYGSQLHLLIRSLKEGLGKAYTEGFLWALAHHYDYICSMDADFSHSPMDIPKLLDLCIKDNINVSIGSRYIRGSKIKNWSFARILLSYMANGCARLITGLPVKDVTAGFVCYQASILKHILSKPIVSVGYSFQVEMKFRSYQYGALLVEWPIVFTDRVRGKTKMNFTMAGEGFFRLLQMRWLNYKY